MSEKQETSEKQEKQGLSEEQGILLEAAKHQYQTMDKQPDQQSSKVSYSLQCDGVGCMYVCIECMCMHVWMKDAVKDAVIMVMVVWVGHTHGVTLNCQV